MLITSRRTATCQPVAEVWLTVVAPLGAVSHRFNVLIIENNEIGIKNLPLLIFLYPIKVLNYLWGVIITSFHKIKWRDEINHMDEGIKSKPRKFLN